MVQGAVLVLAQAEEALAGVRREGRLQGRQRAARPPAPGARPGRGGRSSARSAAPVSARSKVRWTVGAAIGRSRASRVATSARRPLTRRARSAPSSRRAPGDMGASVSACGTSSRIGPRDARTRTASGPQGSIRRVSRSVSMSSTAPSARKSSMSRRVTAASACRAGGHPPCDRAPAAWPHTVRWAATSPVALHQPPGTGRPTHTSRVARACRLTARALPGCRPARSRCTCRRSVGRSRVTRPVPSVTPLPGRRLRRSVVLGSTLRGRTRSRRAGSLQLRIEDLLELLGEPRPHPGPGRRGGVVVAPAVTRGLGRREIVAGVVVGTGGCHRCEGASSRGRRQAGPGAGSGTRARL